MRRLLSALVLSVLATGIVIGTGAVNVSAAPSPLGTYDACVGTCGCQPKTQAPVVAAGSVTNECGMVSGASISGSTVTAFAWGESATLSADGSTLAWEDGSNWVRAATTPPQDPNSSRGKQAAQKAKDLEGAPYLWGGKGQNAKTGAPLTSTEIKDGYPYWNPSTGKLENGKGVDCSGLVKWTYNSTRGSSDVYIHYDNADGQYRNNSKPIEKSELTEGDLLFFGDGNSKTHVAMYMGDGSVIEAPGTGLNVRVTTLDEASKRPNFYSYGRVTPPVFKAQVKAHSPIGISLTDPDGNNINDRTVRTTTTEVLTEVPGELYYSVRGIDDQGMPEDMITMPSLKPHIEYVKIALALQLDILHQEQAYMKDSPGPA